MKSIDQRVKKPGKGEAYNYFDEFNLKLESVDTTLSEIRKTVIIYNNRLSKEFILSRLRQPNKIRADRRDFFAVLEEYFEVTKVFGRETLFAMREIHSTF